MNITDIKGTVTLNNNVKMPYFGLGVYQSEDGDEVIKAISAAIDAGYRLIDTASIYENEKGVGEGIRTSSVQREELFITSKVWNSEQGYDNTLRAFDESMARLGLDYLDLFLIHWPVVQKYKETWRALEKIYSEGRVKAIGVSNFLQHHLEDLMQEAKIVPALNQVEFHPYLVQQELVDYCHEKDIHFQAWSPIIKGKVLEIDLLNKLGAKYEKSAVQVTLRWDLQKGVLTIPKSVTPERIISNADIFDFELTAEEIDQINQLDRNERLGAHPDHFDF